MENQDTTKERLLDKLAAMYQKVASSKLHKDSSGVWKERCEKVRMEASHGSQIR